MFQRRMSQWLFLCMFLDTVLQEAGSRAPSVLHLRKQACMTENPGHSYLAGTSQKDLPFTEKLLSEISLS